MHFDPLASSLIMDWTSTNGEDSADGRRWKLVKLSDCFSADRGGFRSNPVCPDTNARQQWRTRVELICVGRETPREEVIKIEWSTVAHRRVIGKTARVLLFPSFHLHNGSLNIRIISTGRLLLLATRAPVIWHPNKIPSLLWMLTGNNSVAFALLTLWHARIPAILLASIRI